MMRICTFQVPMSENIDHNIATIERCLQTATQHGTTLAVFPEMMLTGHGMNLHEFFQHPAWSSMVEAGLARVQRLASVAGIMALVGAPYRGSAGLQNAMLLCDPVSGLRHVGSRTILQGGWREHWGFVAPPRKDPVQIGPLQCGFVVCDEARQLSDLTGIGLEASQVIFWPSIILNNRNDAGAVEQDYCSAWGSAIARQFQAWVIQSSYVTQVVPLESNRTLGGTVIADPTGQIVQQAPYTEEACLVVEIS